ncbi:MAG: hypothetical protein ACE5I3_13070 [Phycisphaerae bacterium]
MKAIVMCLAALLATLPAIGQQTPPARNTAQPSEPKTVRVTAEGYNRDDALKRALRKALEQGAGVQIAAYSQVANYELIRDTIYSRAAGIVSDYRMLEEKPGAGGTAIVTIEATVRPDVVAATWGEVQNLLDQLGRPKIMVWIDEHIDGRLQKDSIVAGRIEELFTKAGFDLVARQAIDDIRRRARAEARAEGNAAKLAQLAKDAGAHILIRGTANANRAGLEKLYDIPAAFYNCDVQARVYYTDTGKLLASESLPQTRAGVRSRKEFSPQAARAALVKATFPEAENPALPPPLADRIYHAVMEQWSTQITAGGDIELEVQGLDFRSYLKIKKALADVEHVRKVDGDFTKGIATFRVRADLSAETLAEQLTEPPFEQWLEVTDLKLNRIEAKAVVRP